MIESYLNTLKKYFEFKGRADKKEFWIFYLINFCFLIVLTKISETYGAIFWACVLLPHVAVFIRRMHDRNLSGWYSILPPINIFEALIKGTKGSNNYGPDPKEAADKSS